MNKRSGTETRRIIVNAAKDVFLKYGYAAANIRRIARAAGMSVGSIYLYFKNKEELYKSLIRDRRNEMGAGIEKAIERAASATEALSEFLRLYVEYALKHREFILLHIREHGFTFGLDEKREFFQNQRKLLEKIIARGIRDGEFRKCNARGMAKLIQGSLRGIALSMALDKDVVVTPKMLREFIFDGLQKTDREV